MGLKHFLKPNGAKILLFLFLLIFAPFPYFFQPETSDQFGVRWIWGFPPLVSLIYDYLPASLQELNVGIFDINKVTTTYYWTPTYAFFIFLLSCVIHLIIERIKVKYNIATFRGLLWRKLEKKEIGPLRKVERHEKVEEGKKEIKPEEKKEEIKLGELEEMDEEKIKEMSTLIREEETFLKEQKKKLQKYLDKANIQKLKSIGVDVEENKILCSGCKRWIKVQRSKLMKLIEKHGFDIIWEYKCPECKSKK